jgi:hypothetical protein
VRCISCRGLELPRLCRLYWAYSSADVGLDSADAVFSTWTHAYCSKSWVDQVSHLSFDSAFREFSNRPQAYRLYSTQRSSLR